MEKVKATIIDFSSIVIHLLFNLASIVVKLYCCRVFQMIYPFRKWLIKMYVRRCVYSKLALYLLNRCS